MNDEQNLLQEQSFLTSLNIVCGLFMNNKNIFKHFRFKKSKCFRSSVILICVELNCIFLFRNGQIGHVPTAIPAGYSLTLTLSQPIIY